VWRSRSHSSSFLPPLSPNAISRRWPASPSARSYLDLAIDGNDLWVATSYGLSLYDRTVDPPALVLRFRCPGSRAWCARPMVLAYAGSGTMLYVVRKKRRFAPARPRHRSRRDDQRSPPDHSRSLRRLIERTDAVGPARPDHTVEDARCVSRTSRANVQSLALSGSTLFAADGDSSIESFHIKHPLDPERGRRHRLTPRFHRRKRLGWQALRLRRTADRHLRETSTVAAAAR